MNDAENLTKLLRDKAAGKRQMSDAKQALKILGFHQKQAPSDKAAKVILSYCHEPKNTNEAAL